MSGFDGLKDIKLIPGAAYGFRKWHLLHEEGKSQLRGSYGYFWLPGVNIAKCEAGAYGCTVIWSAPVSYVSTSTISWGSGSGCSSSYFSSTASNSTPHTIPKGTLSSVSLGNVSVTFTGSYSSSTNDDDESGGSSGTTYSTGIGSASGNFTFFGGAGGSSSAGNISAGGGGGGGGSGGSCSVGYDLESIPVHDVPYERCGCGFWSYWTVPAASPLANAEWPQFSGVVKGFGRTLIGDLGMRSTKARIVALAADLPLSKKLLDAVEYEYKVPVYRDMQEMLRKHPLTTEYLKLEEDDSDVAA